MSCHASYNPISHKEKLVWLRISKWYYNIIFQQKLVRKKEKEWNTCCITLFGNNGFISSIKHLLCALRYICIYKSFFIYKVWKVFMENKNFFLPPVSYQNTMVMSTELKEAIINRFEVRGITTFRRRKCYQFDYLIIRK